MASHCLHPSLRLCIHPLRPRLCLHPHLRLHLWPSPRLHLCLRLHSTRACAPAFASTPTSTSASTAPPDLTTSAKCFDDVQVSFGDGGTDEFGALDGTGAFEALRSTVSAPFDAQVHRGFARRAMKYSRWVQAELRKEDAFPPENATAPWNHGGIASLKDLYVTGHSLGGAASLAFAYWVKVWPQSLELCSPSPLTSSPTLTLTR